MIFEPLALFGRNGESDYPAVSAFPPPCFSQPYRPRPALSLLIFEYAFRRLSSKLRCVILPARGRNKKGHFDGLNEISVSPGIIMFASAVRPPRGKLYQYDTEQKRSKM